MNEEKRVKSSAYPGATWNDALDLTMRLANLGKQAGYQALADEYGLKNVKTPSFSSKISSARQFGFISAQNQVATLTDDGRKLVFPSPEEELNRLRIKCFSSPSLYRKLIDRFEGKAIPTQKVLENYLLHDYGITPSAKTNVAQVFLSSVEQLGFNKAGVLVLENDIAASDSMDEHDVVIKQPPAIHSQLNAAPIAPIISDSQYHRFEIPTLRPGVTAQVLIPSGLSDADLDFVQEAFDFMSKRFIDKLRKENAALQEIT